MLGRPVLPGAAGEARLLALGENACDFAPLLGWARALREQIDWELLRTETAESPFAQTFLQLLTSLRVIAE